MLVISLIEYCGLYSNYFYREFRLPVEHGRSSSLECSETYHGGAPFSQVEARNVRDAILSVANQTKVYFSFHSYGQYWLTPWGYTSALPDDYQDLVR